MSLINRFLADKSGNFAMIFGITLLPISMALGIAVDYSRLSSDHSKVQDRLDAAVVAGAIALKTKSEAEAKKAVIDHFNATLPPELAARIGKINVTSEKKKGSIVADVSGHTNTTIMGIIGKDKMEFDVNASAIMQIGKMEIAMVLDNTGSMSSDGKLASLKESSKSFVKSIFENNPNGEIKISLVPFARYVNVGEKRRNAAWINVPKDYSKQKTYTHRPVLSTYDCVPTTYYSDGILKNGRSCKHTYGDPVKREYTQEYKWYGCVGSRKNPLNLQDKKYNGKNRIPGLIQSWKDCPNELQTLTNKKGKLLKKLDKMKASGSTYIPTGVMWGWRTLSKKAPFKGANPEKSSTKTQKVMILMTDGDNSVSAQLPGSSTHYGNDVSEANDWTKQACNNTKDDGISIFTITFGKTIKDETKALMVNCASSPDNYFDANNGSELNKAFEGILAKVSKLYLSS